MDFRRFSLSIYAEPGVAPACIALQDSGGADVNLLLFALWAAHRGARLTAADVTGVEQAVQAWRTGVVEPLRAARRALKPTPMGFDPAAAEALRGVLQAAELEAERLQQERIAPLVPAASEEPSALLARANLETYGHSIPARFPEPQVAMLPAAWARTNTTRTDLSSPE